MVKFHVGKLLLSVVWLLLGAIFSPQVQAQISGCTSITQYQYAPSTGRTFISEDAAGRYVYQYFRWGYQTGHDRLYWFKLPYVPGATFSAGTFEQDTFFYNYDGQAYGTAPTGYWASDQPYPYVDTQLFDPGEEKAVTVGSAHAYDFQSGPLYYYVTRMTSGPGSLIRFKTQVQRGLRDPPSCYSTYCSFGCDEPANYDRMIPFDAGAAAPVCKDYTFWAPPFSASVANCPP